MPVCMRLLVIGIYLAILPSAWAEASDFVIFDGLAYARKPSPAAPGMVPITWIGDLWRPQVSKDSVDEVQVSAIFDRLRTSTGYYYLDIENWPVNSVSAEVRDESIQKLTRVIDLARREAPKAHLGFYGILPGITYWPLLRHDGAYDDWLAGNRAVDGLAMRVDAVFPSLYTFSDDREAWKSYARQTLIEARRYHKPVYAFLWPEFHDSTPRRGQLVPALFWREQLALCAELADGIVLWGGWQQSWNPGAPWWQETQRFMRALDESGRLGKPPGM